MNEEEIRRIVAQSVTETLMRLGIEADDPLEAQKDFQHLRSWRTSTEAIKRQSFVTATVVIVTGALGLLWLAIKGGN